MTRSHIGEYEILGEAGRGGMGIVYHARDASLERDVAIKVLPDAVAASEQRMARFHREAKLLASLNHPNIAAIYGLGQDGDHPFVVMEYVDGQLLADRIAQGPMPWQDMVVIAIQIANAVQYAHQHGVIHRDLKPPNIKFTQDGDIKVLDFGLAKAIEDPTTDAPDAPGTPPVAERDTIQSLSEVNRNVGSTMPGALMGTAGYLSPEQARGKDVDKQSDIFSFGCLLFEMLTGDAPFASDSAIDAIGRTLHKDPDWSHLPNHLPSRLIKLLRRCLAKDKKDRLHDIGDARIELEELQDDQPQIEAAMPASNTAWKAVAIVAALAAIGFATLYAVDQPTPVAATHAPLTNRSITIPKHLVIGPFDTLDNDANILIACVDEDGTWRLYARSSDNAALLERHQFTGAAGTAFAPDGRSFAVSYSGRILRGDVDTNHAPVELARIPDARQTTGPGGFFPSKRDLVWFDEDTLILEANDVDENSQLVLVSAKTGDVQRRIPLILPQGDLRLDGLVRRFDDDHVLMYVSQYNDKGFSVGLATVSISTGELKMLVDRAGDAHRIGNRLFFSRGDAIFMADVDPQTHAMLDAGQSIQSGLYTDYGAHGSFDITDSGTLLYKPGGTQAGNRRLMMNTGQGAKPTGFPTAAYDSTLTVSGDGSRLCVTRLRNDGMWEIWGGTTDPPRLRRLLSATDMDFAFPRLSDDGTILSFARIASDQDGVQVDVLVQPFNGSSPATLVIEDLKLHSYRISGFSTDNKRLVADVTDPAMPSQRRMVELDIATGKETDLLTRVGGASRGMWSPNGDLLSFLTSETGELELHLYNPEDGSTMRASPLPVMRHQWLQTTDDGLSLLFLDANAQGWTMTVTRDDTGSLLVGNPVSYQWIHSEDAVAYDNDIHGRGYTIEPGVNDGPPNHVVVIEHWLDSVTRDNN